MRAARVLVSLELLREVLNFPSGTEVRFVEMVREDQMSLVITHPDLPYFEIEGARPPLARPSFRKNDDGSDEFIGWVI